MAKYQGISTKTLQNGSTAIMVRFKYQSTTYPVKNFTKLFGCTTETQANNKLNEVKVLISNGVDPFSNTPYTLNEIWSKRLETKEKSGEWKNITRDNYTYYYEAHIKKVIGHKKLNKITYEDLEKILMNIADRQGGTKNTLKKLLFPIFEEAIKKGHLQDNIIKKLNTHKIGNDKNIGLRTNEEALSIIKKLYDAIPNYYVHCKAQEEEFKMFLYMVVLTAHRVGEIMQLKKEDIDIEEKKIISPPTITKTKEYYHFPIPQECLEYIENIESGLLFPTIKRGSLYAIFQRLLKLTDIKFYKGKTLSMHDMRRLMLSVMIIDCKIDSRLADACLSHKQTGVIRHYLSFSYKNINKSYKKYWKKVREVEE